MAAEPSWPEAGAVDLSRRDVGQDQHGAHSRLGAHWRTACRLCAAWPPQNLELHWLLERRWHDRAMRPAGASAQWTAVIRSRAAMCATRLSLAVPISAAAPGRWQGTLSVGQGWGSELGG